MREGCFRRREQYDLRVCLGPRAPSTFVGHGEVGEELRRGDEDGVRCRRSQVQEYHLLGPGILGDTRQTPERVPRARCSPVPLGNGT